MSQVRLSMQVSVNDESKPKDAKNIQALINLAKQLNLRVESEIRSIDIIVFPDSDENDILDNLRGLSE